MRPHLSRTSVSKATSPTATFICIHFVLLSNGHHEVPYHLTTLVVSPFCCWDPSLTRPPTSWQGLQYQGTLLWALPTLTVCHGTTNIFIFDGRLADEPASSGSQPRRPPEGTALHLASLSTHFEPACTIVFRPRTTSRLPPSQNCYQEDPKSRATPPAVKPFDAKHT